MLDSFCHIPCEDVQVTTSSSCENSIEDDKMNIALASYLIHGFAAVASAGFASLPSTISRRSLAIKIAFIWNFQSWKFCPSNLVTCRKSDVSAILSVAEQTKDKAHTEKTLACTQKINFHKNFTSVKSTWGISAPWAQTSPFLEWIKVIYRIKQNW